MLDAIRSEDLEVCVVFFGGRLFFSSASQCSDFLGRGLFLKSD